MKCLVLGTGISGRGAADLLSKEGYEVEFAKNEDINAKDFEKEYLDRLFSGLSFIVTSPGISPRMKLIDEAKKRKINVYGELEYGANKLKSDIIAVTGTNGKTTTVSLIYFLLKDINKKVFLGGNVGVSVSSFVGRDESRDIAVLECSSFQLEQTKQFCPHISAILNITPDHLNRHKTMRNYIECKFKIFKNQTEKDFLLLNADDEILMNEKPKTKSQIFYFSTKKTVKGCYIKRNCIYFNDGIKEIKLTSLKGIKLVGEHNLSNILCATLAVFLQTNNLRLFENLKNFGGVSHRIEFVKKIKGIEFYNDSKATNIDSVIVACKSFKNNIGLILGGSDKGYCFDDLFEKLPKNVQNIAIFGETKHKIAISAEKYKFKNYFICENLDAATRLLFSQSKENDIVLLSPACASFDFFSNYEERGNFFKKIVKEIELNETFDFKTKETKPV